MTAFCCSDNRDEDLKLLNERLQSSQSNPPTISVSGFDNGVKKMKTHKTFSPKESKTFSPKPSPRGAKKEKSETKATVMKKSKEGEV